jgi:hypothetical protein
LKVDWLTRLCPPFLVAIGICLSFLRMAIPDGWCFSCCQDFWEYEHSERGEFFGARKRSLLVCFVRKGRDFCASLSWWFCNFL